MISCQEYDYIEIVCMYRYPITLTMKSGEVIECTALDTKQNTAREECVKVDVDGVEKLVELDAISQLDVRVDNPHFKNISF